MSSTTAISIPRNEYAEVPAAKPFEGSVFAQELIDGIIQYNCTINWIGKSPSLYVCTNKASRKDFFTRRANVMASLDEFIGKISLE